MSQRSICRLGHGPGAMLFPGTLHCQFPQGEKEKISDWLEIILGTRKSKD
jgi:hypothetical protein